eukprot:COSAG02_NODE_10865_length_1843_cov_3.879587_2_plen_160_part_00
MVSRRSSAGAVRRRGYGAPRRGRCAPSARSGQSDRRERGARDLQSRCRPAQGRWATLTLPTHPLPSSFVAIPPPIAAPRAPGHRPRARNCMPACPDMDAAAFYGRRVRFFGPLRRERLRSITRVPVPTNSTRWARMLISDHFSAAGAQGDRDAGSHVKV